MLYTYYICVISGPDVDQRWRKGGGMVEERWRKQKVIKVCDYLKIIRKIY